MLAAAAAGSVRVAILGTGRMARAAVDAASAQAGVVVTALVGPQAPDWDTDLAWCAHLDELPDTPELLIDFSLPRGTETAAAWCRERGVPLLSGVTGLPDAVRAGLGQAAERIPVLWSPNLSLGVNLLADLAARAAAVLDAATPVLIEDIHHQGQCRHRGRGRRRTRHRIPVAPRRRSDRRAHGDLSNGRRGDQPRAPGRGSVHLRVGRTPGGALAGGAAGRAVQRQ
jgi:hypothetical protein